MVNADRPTRGHRVFQRVNGLILTGVVVVTLYPFLNIVARSFSGERQIRAGEVTLWPKGFNLTTYKIVFQDGTFWRNYGNTVFYTVVSTAVAMVLTTCYAYVLSKRNLKGARSSSASPCSPCSSPAGSSPPTCSSPAST